ncbi:phosphate acyltransferase PlsX [Simkania negevensis]|uniref:Phosphate acyltransferase n=1 Tax=Simkania negevensis TaxID=83561 RepID=A0ABS3ARM8_9BACT|nr:phosphate acyltransferase PlsX [Simkania negevensis]
MRIGVDIMGGDTPPNELFSAVYDAAEAFAPSVSFVVFAQEKNIVSLETRTRANIEFVSAKEIITMEDPPLLAVRRKKESSICLGIKALKEKKIDAFVSLGNTGALIASAMMALPTLPSIERAALIATLPTAEERVSVLDVGATVGCKPHHMVQFSRLGAAYKKCIEGVELPRVGLLNIGVEQQKGTGELRDAYRQLEALTQEGHFHFVGNVESTEVFRGQVDVLVTEGFTGNVFLKTVEGVSTFIVDYLQQAIAEHLDSEEVRRALEELKTKIHYAEYPGGLLLGVDGVVVKCHGKSSPKALFNGIKGAKACVENNVVSKVSACLLHSS